MGMFVCSCASMISDHAYTNHSANLWQCVSRVSSRPCTSLLHGTYSKVTGAKEDLKPDGVYPREKSNRVCQCMGNACTYKCAGALHICVHEYAYMHRQVHLATSKDTVHPQGIVGSRDHAISRADRLGKHVVQGRMQ